MIIRILKDIIVYVVGSYVFYSTEEINLRTILTNMTTHLQAMSTLNTLIFFRDLVLNRLTENYFFRIIPRNKY